MKRIGIIVAIIATVLTVGCNTKEAAKPKEQVVEKSAPVETKKEEPKKKEPEKKEPAETKEDKAQEYDFSAPVPEGQRVSKSYFDDALFIGDSRTVGFMQCVHLPKATAYASEGCLVNSALAQQVKLKDGTGTVAADALKKESFGKVYLMYGVNETGWAYTSKFVERYQNLIDYVKKTQKNAVIYVQAIYPVSEKVSDTHDYITNERINEYNEALQKLAEDENVYYVDVAEAVSNAEGALPPKAAVDGIHLRKKYCRRWLSYLRNHTIEK